jgi:hypothetical protein
MSLSRDDGSSHLVLCRLGLGHLGVSMNRYCPLLTLGVLVLGCYEGSDAEAGACIPVASVADYVHTTIEADRATYAEQVVHRLQNVERVLKASEKFQEDKALPLPSQMLRMGAKAVAGSNQGKLRYALISEWSINKANMPKTDFEKKGLSALAKNPNEPYRGFQKDADERYYMALYPDKAVSQACVDCHNDHAESPRQDFKLGDVMGGIVITMRVD